MNINRSASPFSTPSTSTADGSNSNRLETVFDERSLHKITQTTDSVVNSNKRKSNPQGDRTPEKKQRVSPSDTSTINSGQITSLTSLPREILTLIFKWLPFNALLNVERVSKACKDTIYAEHLKEIAYFERFPRAFQNQYKTLVKSEADFLRGLLAVFSEETARHLYEKQDAVFFHAMLFFNTSHLMSQCAAFGVSKKGTVTHTDGVEEANFSPDGTHVLTCSDDNKAKIYGRKPKGSWTHRVTITHTDSINSANFSPDGTHVVTASCDNTAKIYGQNPDGSWAHKVTITHTDYIQSANFSPDGTHVVTCCCCDHTAKIYGRNPDGSWTHKGTVTHDDFIFSVHFSPDGTHLVTCCSDHTAKIYGRNPDGSWTHKGTVTHTDGGVESAHFSPDGSQVVTAGGTTTQIYGRNRDDSWACKKAFTTCRTIEFRSAEFSPDGTHLMIENAWRRTARIYGRNPDGSWKCKGIFTDPIRFESARFSHDGTHMLTTEAIYGRNPDGSWARRGTITTGEVGVELMLAKFSPDGTHVVTISGDNTVRIYGRNPDSSWTQKSTITYTHYRWVYSASFSPNGTHVVITSYDNDIDIYGRSPDGSCNTADIYGRSPDGSWVKKGVITHNQAVRSAHFGPYGIHVVTASSDNTVKICQLIPQRKSRRRQRSWKPLP